MIHVYSLPQVEGVPSLTFSYGPHERKVEVLGSDMLTESWLDRYDPAGEILTAAVALVEAIERAQKRSQGK